MFTIFKIGTQYLIFAWNDADPINGNGDWKYHGANQRLQQTTMLLNFKDESLSEQASHLPKDTITRDFRVDNVTLL
jgi:hypothetical protein